MSIVLRNKSLVLLTVLLISAVSLGLSSVLFSDDPPAPGQSDAQEPPIIFEADRPSNGSPYWQQVGRDARHTGRSELRGAQDARLRWTHAETGPFESSLVISEYDRVLFTTSESTWQGYLYCLDLEDGSRDWRYTYYSDTCYPGMSSDSGEIYAFNGGAMTSVDSGGDYSWNHWLGSGGNFTGPTVDDGGNIYMGFGDRLFVVDSSGRFNWSYPLSYWSFSLTETPAVTSNELVYFVSNEQKLYAVDSTGFQWSYPLTVPSSIVPTIDENGNVLVVDSPPYGSPRLSAVAPDGSLAWSYDAPTYIVSSPAVDVDGSIVFGSSSGQGTSYLQVLRSDGTLRWSLSLPYPMSGSPALDVDGSIYTDYGAGYVYALNSFGLPKWSYQTGNNISTFPAVGPYETVLFGSSDGNIYCLESMPRLSDGMVVPAAGTDSDTYSFKVHYFSAAERAPASIFVWVDTSWNSMSLDSGDAWNGEYTYETGLDEGDHSYRFAARDDSNASYVFLPPSGNFSGPIVDNDGDDFEPDDDCSEAKGNGRYISVDGTPQRRTFLPYDADCVMFEAEAGKAYLAQTSDLSPDCDTVLFIYSPDCSAELASDDDSGYGHASAISWTCPEDGAYLLVVKHADSDAAGEYSLSVEPAWWPMFKCGAAGRSRSAALGCPGDSLAWSVDGVGYDHAPVVGMDGRIYSTASNGWLYCMTPSGDPTWSYNANLASHTAPAVAASGHVYVKSQFGYLLALASDGGFRWSFEVDDDIGGTPTLAPDETIYCADENGYLHAIRSDGTEDWSFDSRHEITGSSAIGIDGDIYFGNEFGFLFSLKQDGSFFWFKDLEQAISTTPIVTSSGDVVVLTDEDYLFNFAPDGHLNWTHRCAKGTVAASPALGLNDTILVPTGAGKITAVNSDGSFAWTYSGSIDIESTPAVDRDGNIYIGATGLKSLNPNGSLRWSHETAGATRSSPAIGPDGSVYIEGTSTLYAFSEQMTLSGGDVDPDLGNTWRNYTFDVWCQSTSAPDEIRVFIDGTPYDMYLKDGSDNDGLYRHVQHGLDEGAHEFYFFAESPGGKTGRNPESGVYDGPVVDDTPPTSDIDTPYYVAQGDIPVDFESADNISGVHHVLLYYAFAAGGWTEFEATETTIGTTWLPPISGDGSYHFASRGMDNVGNWEDFPGNPESTTVYDSTKPSSACNSPEFTNTSPFGVGFTAGDTLSGLDNVSLWFNKDGGGWTYFDSIAEAEEGTFDFTPTGQGLYEFYTIARDMAGNEEDAPSDPDCTTIYDLTKPSSHCGSPAFTNASPFEVNFNADDASSGVAEVSLWFSKDGGAWTEFDSIPNETDGTFHFIPEGEGTYEFYTIALDKAGNQEDAPGTADSASVYDTTKPASVCDSPAYSNEPTFAVDFDANDDSSGMAEVSLWYNKDGAGWKHYDTIADTPAGSFDFNAPDEGEYGFYTIALDRAGNAEAPPKQPDSTTLFDSKKPESSCTSPRYDNSSPIPVEFEAQTGESGQGAEIDKVELYYSFEDGAFNLFGEMGADSGTFDFDDIVDCGKYGFYTIAYDVAGNQEDPPDDADTETVFDNIPPTSACTSPQCVTSGTITVDFTAGDAHSSIATVDFYWKTDDTAWAVFETANDEDSGSVEFSPPGENTYQFATRAKDHADNLEAWTGDEDSETLYDTQRPVSSCDSPQYVSGATIAVSYAAQDSGSGVRNVALWFRFNGGSWKDSGLHSGNTAGVFDFVPENMAGNNGLLAQDDTEGQYDFYTVSTDFAGWTENPPANPDSSTSFDTERPWSTCSSPDFATSPEILVSYTAGDTTSGIASVDLYYASPSTGVAFWGTSTEGEEGTFAFNAGEEGVYEFYTIAHDQAGNSEQPPGGFDTSTLFDGTAPVSTCDCPQVANSSPISVSFEAQDALSGVDRVELYVRVNSGGWTLSDTAYGGITNGVFDVAIASDGLYDFVTLAYDVAGNVEQYPNQPDCSCRFDTQLPSSKAHAPACANGATFVVGFEANDDAAGVESVQLFYNSSVDNTWNLYGESTAGTVGVFDFDPMVLDGARQARFWFYTLAIDRAGNEEDVPGQPDDGTIYDVIPPTTSCNSPTYASQGSIEVEYEADGELAGLDWVRLYYRLDSSGAAWVEGSAPTTAAIGVFHFVPPSGDGAYEFAIGAADNCGNESPPAAACGDTIYDATKPLSVCDAPTFVTEASVEIEYVAGDGLSGLAKVRFMYKHGNGSWHDSGLEAYATRGTVSFDPPDGDGIYRFFSRAFDWAGNAESAPPAPDCITVVDRSQPSLSNGTVIPPTGTPDTDYTFSVEFEDADGQAPSESTVFIDGQPYPMALAYGDPADGTYGCTRKLPSGNHRFFFWFSDAFGLPARLPASGDFSGPVVNTPPAITNGGVSPDPGDTETMFDFWANYSDEDGDEPVLMEVSIDGTAFEMSLVSGATLVPYGGRYVFSCQLPFGDHSYSFTCQDALGGTGKLPAAGEFDGPAVEAFDNEAPYCTDMDPADGDTDVPADSSLSLKVLDDGAGVDGNSIRLWVQGILVNPLVTPITQGFSLEFAPPVPPQSGTEVHVTVSACDNSIRRNCLDRFRYSFRIADTEPPRLFGVTATAGRTAAAVGWSTNEPADGVVEYCPDGGATAVTSSTIMRTVHAFRLGGLTPGTTYRYRVGSTDEAGNGPAFSSWRTFVTSSSEDSEGPRIVAGIATAVFDTSVTILWATDEPAQSVVLVSTSEGDLTRGRNGVIVQTDDDFQRYHSVLIEGLSPDTLCYGRVICADVSGNTTRSEVFDFTSGDATDDLAPTILEGPRVIYTTDEMALIGWVADELCTAYVEYGQSDDYGQTASDGHSAIAHGVLLTGLLPGAEYHYGLRCTDLLGNGPSTSPDYTFRTLVSPDTEELVCTSGPSVEYVTDSFARVEWVTNKVSDTGVTFWVQGTASRQPRTYHCARLRRVHRAFLGGLQPDTTYDYIVSSTDLSGNSLAQSEVGSFTTLSGPDTEGPSILNVAVSYNMAGKARIDWETSEPADSRIFFWRMGTKKTTKGGWAGTENQQQHSGWLDGLDPGSGYEYQVGSEDASGNVSWSARRTFDSNGDADVAPPGFASGPDVETRRGPAQAAIVWTTTEIADTLLVYWRQGAIEEDKHSWASYEHAIGHRVELAGLEPGQYQFEASSVDPAGNSTETRGGTFTIAGSTSEPRLYGGFVEPGFGSISTEFGYQVHYTHQGGSGPLRANLVIDGVDTRTMVLLKGDANDGVYALTTSLPSGQHTFAFKFQSSTAAWVSSPKTGVFEGPVVSAIPDFSLAVRTDSEYYEVGDTQTVSVDAGNAGDAYDVDLYACVRKPDGELLFWPSMGTDPIPVPIAPFPGHTSFMDFELHSFTIPPEWSAGQYTWFVGVVEPGTLDTLCEIASTNFVIRRYSVELDMALNADYFLPESEMVLSLSARNPGGTIQADLYAYVILPDGSALHLPGLTPNFSPIQVELPAGIEVDNYELFRATVPPGLPAGDYRWEAGLTLRGTSELISDVVTSEFALSNVTLVVWTNGTEFAPGDVLRAYIDMHNLGPDVDLDLYVWVLDPGGAAFYLPYLTPLATPFERYRPLPAGANCEALQVLNVTLPEGLAEGIYCLQAVFVSPDTGSNYGREASACFRYPTDLPVLR